MTLTNETLIEAVDALKRYGTQTKAAEALGILRPGFVYRLKIAAMRGLIQTEPGERYQVPEGMLIKGVSTLVDEEGAIKQQWIKTQTDTTVADLVETLKGAFEDYKGGSKPAPVPNKTNSDLLSVYPIADQHVGLLAWGQETGEAYDLKIGIARLRDSMARLVRQSPASEQALILNLGDWQHTDDQRNVTPGHGHQLDVDSRYAKILMAGVQLMIDCIELAKAKHNTVLVRNLPGNHDPHAAVALTVALGCFYANDPRVTIDDDPSDFFYHRFGATLLGATHGHKTKPDRMAMAMATTCRADWGATDYHWFLFGHIHHETVKEVGDVRVESFQTLAAKDAYGASHGFSAGQSLQSVTLHRLDGEIGRHRINIPPPKRSV